MDELASVALFIREDIAEIVMLSGYIEITGIPMQADCIHLPKLVNGGLFPQISQLVQQIGLAASAKREFQHNDADARRARNSGKISQ